VKTIKWKSYYFFLILFVFSIFSCVQYRPKITYEHDLPHYSFYPVPQGVDDKIFEDYTVNDVYIYADLNNYPERKLFHLDIRFTGKRYTEKEYTSFIIKDLAIVSKSNVNYIDGIEIILPFIVPINKKTDNVEQIGIYKTGAVIRLKFEEIIVTVVVEINTTDSTETKTLIYNFKPKRNLPVPIFILPFQ
jgi:hypothetical protein